MRLRWQSFGVRVNDQTRGSGLINRWAAYELTELEISPQDIRIRMNVYRDHADVWYFGRDGKNDVEDQEFTKIAVDNGDSVFAQGKAMEWLAQQIDEPIDVVTGTPDRLRAPDIRPLRVHPKTAEVMREIKMTEADWGENVFAVDPPIGSELHNTTDAQQWADQFLKQHGGKYLTAYTIEDDEDIQIVDFGIMVAWFANAIETGRSFGVSDLESPVLQLDQLEDFLSETPGTGPRGDNDTTAEWAIDVIKELMGLLNAARLDADNLRSANLGLVDQMVQDRDQSELEKLKKHYDSLREVHAGVVGAYERQRQRIKRVKKALKREEQDHARPTE